MMSSRFSDTIVDATARAVQAEDRKSASGPLKELTRAAWLCMTPEDRRELYFSIDVTDEDLSFFRYPKRWPKLNNPDLEDAQLKWGGIRSWLDGKSGKDVEFATSIARQIKFKNWTPSAGQQKQMIRLYRAWQRWMEAEDG